ncbi:AtpZ/AtpI family protein [Polycladidibacter stylochi]|uniref:AtpZ/AtpI family protein n=1 Tax=Polycladidibacter stylochi TaxID=1807766 RepID=UPI00082DC258|nr:AtpZ/AtpI family protein [Pseudovibrio stylochi]
MSSNDKRQLKQGQPDQEVELSKRLDSLGAKLDQHLKTEKSTEEKAGTSAGAGLAQAWKISSEFVAGVLVGAALGWAIDSWLGTKPWGLIVFLLLGFAAGILNVLRDAGKVAQPERRLNDFDRRDN